MEPSEIEFWRAPCFFVFFNRKKYATFELLTPTFTDITGYQDRGIEDYNSHCEKLKFWFCDHSCDILHEFTQLV